MTDLLSGVIEKIIPGKQQHEKYADAMWDFAVDRYGGWEEVKNTMQTDPVGFAFDVSTAFTGAGGALKTAANVAGKTGKIADVANVLYKVGAVTDPAVLTARGLGKVGSLVTGSLPPIIYKHAAGLPTNMPIKKRIAAVETALEEAIPLSHNGMDKLWVKINKVDSEVSDIIKSGKYKTASMDEINKHIDDVIDFYNDIPDSTTEIKHLEKLKEKNIKQFGMDVPAARAQQMKKKVYKQLREAYDRQTPIKIVKEKGQMATAKGAMIELEQLYPEIKNLNKTESEYLNLFKAIEKSVPRIANQKYGIFNPFNLTVGGSIGYATNSVPAGLGALGTFLIIKNPVVQSRIAIALKKAGKAGAVAKQVPTSTGKVLYESQRVNQNTGEQQ